MPTFTTLFAVQSTTEQGLTLHKIVQNLPTDPLSLVTLFLLIASFVLVLWSGGRTRGGGGGADRAPPNG